jgi:hypothetical protein
MQSEAASFSQPSAQAKLAILILFLLATIISVEYLARVMHDHRMATLRVEAGVTNALLIRQSSDHQQLLFAGNSLIYDDLSESELQQSLGPGFLVHTAGVPGSTYYDWSYGLRALFARGSQPDVIVFSISPSQFLRQPAATPMPVALLWGLRDILDYRREERLNLTQLTELLLEHYSAFYSMRDTIRIYIRKFIPGYESMVHTWTAPTANFEQSAISSSDVLYKRRLSKLAAECNMHTQLILMLSPTNQIEDEKLEPELKAAAGSLGISIIEPIAEREWPPAKFRDDHYHLTPPAAAEFSKLVATDLRQKLTASANRVEGH